MTLTKLGVRGFRSLGPGFGELAFEPDVTVLIGPNGAGKSNILAAMAFLSQIARRNLQASSDGASQLLYQGPKVSPEMTLSVWGRALTPDSCNGYQAELEHLPQEDRLRFREEWCYFQASGHDRPFHELLGRNHRESMLESPPVAAKRIAAYVRKNALSWRVFHFHDTSPNSPPKQSCEADNNVALQSDAGNLAAFLFRLQQEFPESYGWIRDTIRQAAPFFEDFELKPSPKNQLRLLWRQQGSEAALGPQHLSDGTLRFICLAVLLLQPDPPSTVLLDEPELGLHPFALNLAGQLIRSAATRCQIVCSTQSSTLVSHFEARQIRVVELSSEGTLARQVSGEELSPWLEDYSLGQLWEMNLMGGRP